MAVDIQKLFNEDLSGAVEKNPDAAKEIGASSRSTSRATAAVSGSSMPPTPAPRSRRATPVAPT